VGDVASGESLAGLYSLVATCESRGINPFDYLTDALARVQDHPANAIAELLPGARAAAGALSDHAAIVSTPSTVRLRIDRCCRPALAPPPSSSRI